MTYMNIEKTDLDELAQFLDEWHRRDIGLWGIRPASRTADSRTLSSCKRRRARPFLAALAQR